MTHKQKRLVKKGVITPVAIALILSVFSVMIVAGYDGMPFSSVLARLSNYSSQEVKEITGIDGDIDSLALDDGSVIGSVTIYDTSFPLIYHANSVNANGKMNISIGDNLPGEIGSTYMELFKNDATKLKLVSKGDPVEVGTFYADYEYVVADTFVVKGLKAVEKCGVGADNAVVIYTDNSMGVGISDEYFVAVCRPNDAQSDM